MTANPVFAAFSRGVSGRTRLRGSQFGAVTTGWCRRQTDIQGCIPSSVVVSPPWCKRRTWEPELQNMKITLKLHLFSSSLHPEHPHPTRSKREADAAVCPLLYCHSDTKPPPIQCSYRLQLLPPLRPSAFSAISFSFNF